LKGVQQILAETKTPRETGAFFVAGRSFAAASQGGEEA
jgi:hypothetical protein